MLKSEPDVMLKGNINLTYKLVISSRPISLSTRDVRRSDLC